MTNIGSTDIILQFSYVRNNSVISEELPINKPRLTQATTYEIIYALYGGYVQPRGGEIWTGSLIRALDAIGLNDVLVRTALSRMKKAGYLDNRRIGRRSFYRLTDRGILEINRVSSLASAEQEWSGTWTLLLYSIPEAQRMQRDKLRNLLRTHQFGSLTPGAWISPHPLPSDFERKLDDLALRQYIEIFTAEYSDADQNRTLVSKAWPDLPSVADRYHRFMQEFETIPDRPETAGLAPKDCFSIRFRCLCEFASVVIIDPCLPGALLPGDWPRARAHAVYRTTIDRLKKPANTYFDELYGEGPTTRAADRSLRRAQRQNKPKES